MAVKKGERASKQQKKPTNSSIKLVPRQGEAATAEGASAQRTAPKKKVWQRSGFDYPLFTIVIILLAFGLIMLFSATYANCYTDFGDSLYYVRKQLFFAIGGLVVMLLLSSIDYHIYQKKAIVYAMSAVSLGFMLAVFVIGSTSNGAERWLEIGELRFQPSEILKFALIVLFAYLTQKNFAKIRTFKSGFMPFAVSLAISCGVLLAQPHLSATIIIFLIGFSMMFIAGVNPKHLLLMMIGVILLMGLALLALNAMGIDYFGDRILSFTDPEADIFDKTYQTYESLVTIGSGGVFGLGFGNSRQKYAYLPFAENDFIFSIICEELGLVGAMLVIILFIIFVLRGVYVATHARDKFGMMLAYGITFQIGLQALLNIAVASNSVPNTGISLPFFSYGGTALVMQLAEIGILLSVSRKAALE